MHLKEFLLGLDEFMLALKKLSALLPARELDSPSSAFVFSVDHCFNVRGQGTVMTGTVLRGQVKVGDVRKRMMSSA